MKVISITLLLVSSGLALGLGSSARVVPATGYSSSASSKGFAAPSVGLLMPDIDVLPCLWRSGAGCSASGAATAQPASAKKSGLSLPTLADIEAFIQAAAKKHQVPAAFVKSIVAAESAFNAS